MYTDRLAQNCIPCLGQRGRNPNPLQQPRLPRIGHIREYAQPPPPPPPFLSVPGTWHAYRLPIKLVIVIVK